MGFYVETLGLSETAFLLLRDLVKERIGMFFEESKADLLASKLSPLVIERGFDSFLDYYYLLKYDPSAAQEWHRVMDALSVQETFFWREVDQVQALVNEVVPQHVASRGREPLRIWSAACASGEEPLTLAMALQEEGWFDRAVIQIIATDASPSAIAKAQSGLYRERSFRNLPVELRAKYFAPGAVNGNGASGQVWQVDPALHAHVEWHVANLVNRSEIAPFASSNVVFCRNVFIYFSEDSIRRTVKTLAQSMPVPGYLFVGASESLLRRTTDFNLEEIGGAFVYVKR